MHDYTWLYSQNKQTKNPQEFYQKKIQNFNQAKLLTLQNIKFLRYVHNTDKLYTKRFDIEIKKFKIMPVIITALTLGYKSNKI